MSDPIEYQSASARFDLPFLFAGQAQKEFFVNEALARLDLLLHPAVEGALAAPPQSPAEGQCWIVAAAATAAWAGHDGELAGYSAGDWVFLEPPAGMRVWDRARQQIVLRNVGGWQVPEAPPAPAGGATIDDEARAAIVNLIASLRLAGIFSGG